MASIFVIAGTPRAGTGMLFSTTSGSHLRRWPAVPLLPDYQRECATSSNPFKSREKLINEPLGAAAQVAQDARLGDQNGVDRYSQLGGDCLRGCLVNHLPSEGPPGGGLEVGLDQLQQALQDVLVV